MLIVAIVLALCVALGKAKTGYTFTFWGSVLGIGLICGILLGDVPTALLISAEIQAVYLGFTQSGGVIASDSVIATAITVPIVMNTGLAPEAGLALAIPVGALAANLNTFVYILNGFLYRDALKRADKGDARGITLDATLWAVLIRAFVFGSVVFIGVYFGSSAVQAILDVIPEWLVQGFTVAGGVLPILGFALVVHSINRSDYIPYFIIGFFVYQYLKLPTMGLAIITVCLVLVKFFMQGDVDLSMLKAPEGAEKKSHILTRRDVTRLYFRWWWFVEVAHNYEGMQALSFCNAFIPVFKKLYPEKEEFTAALQRHIGYFNTNGTWGTALHGIVMAMEEEQAMTHAMDPEEFESTVNGLKAGLMGPLAGMGDTIDWGTWNKIFISIGLGYAAVGSAAGVIFSHLGFMAVTLADRKSTRLNSSHNVASRMPSSA